MKFSTRLKVIHRRYFDEFGMEKHIQTLTKQYLFNNFVFWSSDIDFETIPMFVIIARGCYGDNAGWVSKFSPFNKDGIKE